MNLTTSEKNRGFVRFLLMSLLLSILILPAHAQDRVTVSGQLTDSSQTPLIGASVIEKGTTNGVTTDADGRYQISVKPDGVIDFSFIGYKPQSLAVMNRTEINVTMEEDATMIGEVVAIGYGSQRKEDLSMAVSTVKVDDAARSRAADLGTLLQGRMPGVTIKQSGDPLQKASFTVRGRGSKGNDDGTDKSAAYSRDNVGPTSGDGVLVVVDGVPGAPYMAEDIETITILKDAASAAIYGASVGSSGVILITTRQAQAGKTRVNVNVSVGFERAMNLPTMLNAQQFCDVWGKAVENSPGSSLPNLANPQVYAGANVTRTDWLDEIFRTGLTQHYAVSITGGSETLSSILSVTYDKKEGTLLNTWSQALGAKLHTEFKPVKWLKLSERVNFEYSNGQGNISTSHTGPIYGAMWFPASASVYDRDANGNIVYGDDGKPKWGGIASSADMASGVEGPNIVNPVAQLETMHRRYPRTKIFSTTSLEIKPITSLTLKSEFTADLDMRDEDEFSPVIDVPGEHFEPRAVQLQQLPLSLGNDGYLRASLRTPPHQRHGGFHHRLQETTFPRLPHAGLRLQRRPQSGMGRRRLMDQEPERRYSRLLDGLVPCPSRLFVRRPLFPHRQHPPRRIVETARSKELRLVPGHFGIVETLLGEILPECRSQQGLRPREIPCRLG